MNVIRISFNNVKSKDNSSKKVKIDINWETISNILPELKLKISSNSNLKNVLNNIEFPCNVNKDIVDLFIGEVKNAVVMSMYT